MNIAFGMIVFNGNYVLKECLESVYEFASQILISEGPVKYWQEQGHTTSTDGTNDVLHEFYDPDNKIIIEHGQFKEKNEQCNRYMRHMKHNTDYIWNLDSDEIFKPDDIELIIRILKEHKFTSVGFKSLSFYGGFDHYLTGFEEGAEFHRIRKVYPGSYWSTHRPPTIAHRVLPTLQELHLPYNILAEYGVRMYHYSYVFPKQVSQKVQYYKAAVSMDNCIDNYYETIYEPWVKHPELRKEIEEKWEGVHEFKPKFRGPCYPKKFDGEHPPKIIESLDVLQNKFNDQLKELANGNV
tara:strand:- start:1115 stop:2002 length:888 start_codon:yes stop_codon:yes gene_type:complete